MLTLRKAGSLLGMALLLNTAVAQDDAVPAKPGDGPAARDGQDDGFYRASEIIGTTVRSDDGQDLGKVQDLLIERRNQRIRYFLLGDGEELSAQSNLRVVPWTAARPQFRGDDRFVQVRVNQEKWQQAPAYTWQEIQAGPGPWATQVDQFYGVQGRQGLRGRDVEVERDGDVEIEGRNRPRDRANTRDGNVEIERDGDVEIEGRRNRNRDGARVTPNGVEAGDVEVRPDGSVQIDGDRDN